MRENYTSSIGQLYKKTQTPKTDIVDLEAKEVYEMAKFRVECGEILPIGVNLTQVGFEIQYDKKFAEKLAETLKAKYGIVTDGLVYFNPRSSALSVSIIDFL